MEQAFSKLYPKYKRLPWSRGSALPLCTQYRGFNTAEAVRIFKGEKSSVAPPFGGEVKPWVPCRRFPVYKRA